MQPYRSLYIDELDAFRNYGVYLAEGGYNALLQIPTAKTINTSNYQEIDDVATALPYYVTEDPDLDVCPYLPMQALSIPLTFNVADRALAQNFFARLTAAPKHNFRFATTRMLIRKMRLADNNTFTVRDDGRTAQVRINFVEDIPAQTVWASGPANPAPVSQGQYWYSLDESTFNEQGVYILKGSEEPFRRLPKPKQQLIVNINSLNGQSYDGTPTSTYNLDNITFQPQDVALKLFIYSNSLWQFANRYDSLRKRLLYPAYHKLTFAPPTGYETRDIYCIYKSSSVNRFVVRHENDSPRTPSALWLEMTVNFSSVMNPDGRQWPEYNPDIPNPYLHTSHAFSYGFSEAFS